MMVLRARGGSVGIGNDPMCVGHVLKQRPVEHRRLRAEAHPAQAHRAGKGVCRASEKRDDEPISGVHHPATTSGLPVLKQADRVRVHAIAVGELRAVALLDVSPSLLRDRSVVARHLRSSMALRAVVLGTPGLAVRRDTRGPGGIGSLPERRDEPALRLGCNRRS